MQFARLTILLAAGALALAIFFPGTADAPEGVLPPPAAPSRPPSRLPQHPYDSIRTDLNDYQWPTDARRLVTSTFGEYRSTHFHGGIDISTGDVIGYRVFAARAGEVVRVRVDPNGYGKMLYLRHPDGYTTTYAHLRSFAPPIERRVRIEQERLEQYPVTLEFSSGEFPVGKGDLIAFTGETGSGSPHLHFEIRDEQMNGVNPMLAPQLGTEDNIPPSFRGVAFVPLTPGSTVDGDPDPLSLRVKSINAHSYAFTRSVNISGSAGIGVYVRDKGGGTRYSRGVYRHRLFLDGRLIFEVRFDRVPMKESQQIGLYYVRDLLRARAGRFEKLFVDTRNSLPMLSPPTKGSGWLSSESLPKGRHSVAILSQDFQGNTSQLTGSIFVEALPPSIRAREVGGEIVLTTSLPGRTSSVLVEQRGSPEGRWSRISGLPRWDSTGVNGTFPLPRLMTGILRIRAATAESPWSCPVCVLLSPVTGRRPTVRIIPELMRWGIRVDLRSDGIIEGDPLLAVEEGTVRRLFPMVATDEHHWWTWFTPLDSVAGRRALVFEGLVDALPVRVVEYLDLYPVLPGRKGTVTFSNGDVRLEYDSLSVYDTLYIEPKVIRSHDAATYEFQPEGAVLREGLTVTIRSNTPSAKQAIYRRSGAEWSLLGHQDSTGGNRWSARLTDRLSSVALLVDSVPPVIGTLRCAWRGEKRMLATFRVWDELSGVDYKTLKVYIDGKFVVPEIDGEHRRATVFAPEGLTRGPHQMQVRVQDNTGTPSLLEQRFLVP